MKTDLSEYSDNPSVPLPSLEWATTHFLAQYLRLAMTRNGGHQQKAAAELGIHRNTLVRLCDQAGVPRRYGKPKRERQPNPAGAVARRLIGLEPLPPRKPVRAITLEDLPKGSAARARMQERMAR